MAELTLNDITFLKNQDEETLHREMLRRLPDDIDKSEGSFAADFTRPTALRIAKFAEQDILNTIACIFPKFSYGQFLDWHGETRNIIRREAHRATGYVQVTAKEGTEIPEGTVFSTETADDGTHVEFVSVEAVTLESEGTVNVQVEAVEAGEKGNVTAHSITLLMSKLNGVMSVDNLEATTGGLEEEDDEELRERIMRYDSSRQVSHVGSKSDYERWALEVEGVGAATCIPATDDSGLVTLVIVDHLGDPASEELCEKVYNYIQSPQNESARLTNVNATLSVIPPETINITVEATVTYVYGGTSEVVGNKFIQELAKYFATCVDEVKYSKVGAILSGIDGVSDYSDLKLDGGTSNIPIEVGQLARIKQPILVDGGIE